ncbi:flagellar hook-length control protein FliK [Salinimonas sp. HHU 13199]|uniref:Flagellar hook-length control protein FliK n=1 Tax=Salinimonas profundi TaxID=2729140 RepID=A0ABR8LMW0_9ALTE|nr:flagellar hook-length control protein FliK [Salinimonas profundi]MBD3585440.1 flagellar hook-length control protein FliK [Salinimonas profundi]
MSLNIHTFIVIADNLSMISGTLLNSVSHALSAVLPEASPQVSGKEMTQANLSIVDGKARLTLSGHPLMLTPDKGTLSRLPEGSVRLVRDAAQTAVILETFSSTVSLPARINSVSTSGLDVKTLVSILKQNLSSLARPLTASASVVKEDNGSLRLLLRDTPVNIAIPASLKATLAGVNDVQVSVKRNTQSITLTAPSGSPVPLNISKQHQSLLSAALIKKNLPSGIQLVQSPTPLLDIIKSSLPDPVMKASPLLVQARGSDILITIEQLKPLARVKLPVSIISSVTETADKRNLFALTLPVFNSHPVEPVRSESTDKSALTTESIKQLAQKLLQHTGSTNQALKELLTILRQASVSVESKPLMKTMLEQLSFCSANSQTGPTDGKSNRNGIGIAQQRLNLPNQSQISQFAQAILQPISPPLIAQPSPSNSFNSALVSLFQLVLSGRASLSQSNVSSAAYSHMLSEPGEPKNTASTGAAYQRFASELASLDKQAGLLNPLKTLLANHQSAFLSNLESRSQGNDHLYFCLPFRSEYCSKPPEILIKRETDDDNDSTDGWSAKTWSLTMKLEAGDSGEVLAKTKISGETVNLNLYASTPVLLDKIRQTLPMLINRFSASGLIVETAHAQQGKIPDSLQQSPYQVFEVTA